MRDYGQLIKVNSFTNDLFVFKIKNCAQSHFELPSGWWKLARRRFEWPRVRSPQPELDDDLVLPVMQVDDLILLVRKRDTRDLKVLSYPSISIENRVRPDQFIPRMRERIHDCFVVEIVLCLHVFADKIGSNRLPLRSRKKKSG